MLAKTITRHAHWLAKEVGLDSSQEQVVHYSLTILTTTVFGYLAIAIVGLLTGSLLPALTAAFSASLLRVFSGGAHASTPLRCVLSGGVIFGIIGLLSRYILPPLIPTLLGITVLAATVILGLFAPADTPGKPINSKMQHKTLKLTSYSSLFLWTLLIFYLISSQRIAPELIAASIIGMAWQTFSITPLGYLIVHTVERLFEPFNRK